MTAQPNWFSWLASQPMGWLSYSFQRVSLADVRTRLAFLSAVSLANVFVGACLYRLASGETWSRALFKTYGVLFRAPGIGVMNEDTVAASLVLNTIFVFGLFVFAAFLSMISDEIKQQLHAIRMGEVKLPLKGHVVVLNWNQQAISLLKQLHSTQADSSSRLYRRPIVVLADESKASLDAAVAAVFQGSQLRLFCRSGRPAKARDLQMVATESADTVIILHPGSCSSKAAADALKATALVSLTCLRERALGRTPVSMPRNSSHTGSVLSGLAAVGEAACKCTYSLLCGLQTVSAELGYTQGRAASKVANRRGSSSSSMRIVVQMASTPAGGEDVIGFLQDAAASSFNSSTIQQVQLLGQRTLYRLVCQTAAEPGVATVFRELVRAGCDAKLDWCEVGEQLIGSYGRAATMLPGCVLLGVLSAGHQQLTLNPPDHLLLQLGDRLVALTRQDMLSCLSAAPSSGSSSSKRAVLRTVSRVSSMASPQLCLVTNHSNSSSSGGGASPTAKATVVEAVGAAGAVKGPGKGQGLRVMVLGWQEAAVPELMEQLQQAAPRGSHITVVLQAGPNVADISAPQPAAAGAKHDPAAQQQQPKAKQKHLLPLQQDQQQQQHLASGWSQTVLCVSDPCNVQTLLEAGIADADAVILGSALSTAAAPVASEADALVTTAMLAIQQALRTASGQSSTAVQLDTPEGPYCVQRNKLHVVAVVSSYSVRRALQQFLTRVLLHCSFSFEIMVLDEFAAGMLVSVALEPANSLVIDQLLLHPSASGLSIWSVQRLGLQPDEQLTFAAVRQAARQRKCTALGYRRSDGRMVLVPADQGMTTLSAEDRIVLLDGSRRGMNRLETM